MSILKVIQLEPNNLTDKDTILRKESQPVLDFSSTDAEIEIENLLETFYSWKIAVGLSAPQVGVLKKIAIINLDKSKKEDTLLLFNPEIQSESGKKDIKKESCLSVPNLRGNVERRNKIHITFQDRTGTKKQMSTEGFLARVIMHEIDHLNGILYIDRMKETDELEKIDMVWE